MRIYIDEAGGFVVPPRVRPYAYSLVFSLAVPSVVETELLYEFIRLRDGWPRPAVEIKGSQLDESQAAEVLALVSRYDILASYYAVDMTTHGHDVVNDFKLRQAAEITAQLTSQHHPDLIAQLHRDADAIRALPNQLFLQAVLTIDLVLENLRVIPLYYAQRLPNELGNIEWIIDPKDVQRTEMEELWTEFVLPFGEDKFSKKSLKLLPDADYSYFEAAYGVKPDDTEMTAHLRWMHKVHGTPPFTRLCSGQLQPGDVALSKGGIPLSFFLTYGARIFVLPQFSQSVACTICCKNSARRLALLPAFARMFPALASLDGRVAQLGERLVRNEEVRGSSPLTSTKLSLHNFHPCNLRSASATQHIAPRHPRRRRGTACHARPSAFASRFSENAILRK